MNTIQSLGLLTLASVSLTACTSSLKAKDTDILYQYAHANCIFWYFKDKGYSTDDIRSISGGFVEKSSISIDKFQEISLFINDYTPQINTKNNIDIKLNRCFLLEGNPVLENIINN